MGGDRSAVACEARETLSNRALEKAQEALQSDLRAHRFPNRGVPRALRTSRALCGATGAALFVVDELGTLRLLAAQGRVPAHDRVRCPAALTDLAGRAALHWSALHGSTLHASNMEPAAAAHARAAGALGGSDGPAGSSPTAALVLYFDEALAGRCRPVLTDTDAQTPFAARQALAASVWRSWREAWEQVEERSATGREERQRLRALARASRLFASAGRTVDDVLQAVVSETCRHIGDSCSLYLLGDDPSLLHLKACEHRLASLAGPAVALPRDDRRVDDDVVFAACLREGRTLFHPVVSSAMLRHVRVTPFEEYVARHGVSGFIMVPLRAHGASLGVLLVTRMRGAARYRSEDRVFLESLADHAALAIENARAFEEIEAAHARTIEAQRWMQRRQGLRESLASAASVDAVCDTLLHAGRRFLGAHCAGRVSRVGPDDWRWHAASGSGSRGIPSRLHTAIQQGIAASGASLTPFVVEMRAPGEAPNSPPIGEFPPVPRAPRTLVACTLVPLVNAGREGQWLCFGHERQPAPDESRASFVESLGQQGGASLERALLWEKLQASEAEARRLASVQSELMGIVGHDLRNPLAAIRMGAAMMKRMMAGQDRLVTILDRIIASADRGDGLIRDLLDLSCSRLGGRIPVHREDADLRLIARAVVTELETAYPGRKIAVTSEGETTGSWDSRRLSQVLSNLLGNALAYSPARSRVSVHVRGEASRVEVICHNRGDPIPAAALPHLFEAFRGADEEGPRGRGLGLYIVRELVKAHGGAVRVSSSRDEGTRFHVVLPRHLSDEVTVAAPPIAPQRSLSQPAAAQHSAAQHSAAQHSSARLATQRVVDSWVVARA